MTLLGKSGGKPLLEHLLETMDAFEALFGSRVPTRLGEQWLRFFRVPDTTWLRFHRTGLVASGLHDIGKVNDSFQAVVLGHAREQAIRHEHLTALILQLPEFFGWLAEHRDVDADLVLSATAGHHLKSSRSPGDDYPACGEKWSMSDRFSVDLSKEVSSIFATVAARAGLAMREWKLPPRWSFASDGRSHDAFAAARELRKRFDKIKDALDHDEQRQRFFAAVKAAVIVADSVASGLVREQHSLTEWISDAFDESQLIDATYVEREIIHKRVDEVTQKRRERDASFVFCWRDDQEHAENLGPRALLLAPCGSGKTLTAWRWIKAQLGRRPAARVIFLYPTRGTATEGFRDYVSWAPEADAALLHGTARYELEGMFENPDDARNGCHFEPEERLFALGFWQRRIFSATVDQFLAFMQQSYRSICLLPVLCDSVIVFDEVHSFDPKMFAALKRFLETFDLPVLCMTASLPHNRRQELVARGLRLFPGKEKFQELDRLAALSRYEVRATSRVEAEHLAREAFASGKRVLWVVNTVARCQEIASSLEAICYHSRFKLEDRKQRHAEVIDAFQQKGRAAIGVTTQVCEMSLDLDADVLISEYAPITALIQRFGRCNRHARSESEAIGKVYLYRPAAEAPYNASDLQGVEPFVDALHNRGVSQQYLESLLEEYGPRERELYDLARFIDDGPWAEGGRDGFRDVEEWTVQALLDRDVEQYLQRRARRQPTDGLLLPVPNRFGRAETRLPSWLRVADASHYEERFGFLEQVRREVIV